MLAPAFVVVVVVVVVVDGDDGLLYGPFYLLLCSISLILPT
jgi:hypothetical protein